MTKTSRRRLVAAAVALGASTAWGRLPAVPSRVAWRERRALCPEGVASAGTPQPSGR